MDQVNIQSDIDVSFAILYCSIYPTTFKDSGLFDDNQVDVSPTTSS